MCVSNLFLLLLSCIPLFHNLFIHLSVDGHLDCFHFWTINAVMNTNVQEFWHIFPFLLGRFLQVKSLNYMVKCIFNFLRTVCIDFLCCTKIITNLAASNNTHLLSHRLVGQKSRNSQLVIYLRSHKAAIKVLAKAGFSCRGSTRKGSTSPFCVFGSIQFLVAVAVMAAYFSKASKKDWELIC